MFCDGAKGCGLYNRLARGCYLRIHHDVPCANPTVGQAAEFATLEWVHWYNTQRLLEPIGNVAPVEYEMNYYRSQEGSLEMARLN